MCVRIRVYGARACVCAGVRACACVLCGMCVRARVRWRMRVCACTYRIYECLRVRSCATVAGEMPRGYRSPLSMFM